MNLMVAISLLSFTACNAKIKNAKTETVKIYGNCEMCESTIEKAGNVKNTAKVDWNEDTKMAIITYDSVRTNQDEILKRIALAGYDSDQFFAPDDAYVNLHSCCQYDRAKREKRIEDIYRSVHDNDATSSKSAEAKLETNLLKAVYYNYFAIKDALVKTDGNQASAKAKDLQAAIKAVDMAKLNQEEHMIWMKKMEDLAFDARHIEENKNVDYQREHFVSLSKNMYELIKVATPDMPVYYQHCPMADDGKGANWLSMESMVKNPYYGSKMLSCGKTMETIE
jgi:copper chaperone CopZ